MILAFSHPGDDHAHRVLAELARSGEPAVLMDTARFPRFAALTQEVDRGRMRFEMRLDGLQVDLQEARVGWWRRPQPYTLEEGLSPAARSFAWSECHEALAGLWPSLDLAWVNRPALDEIAHHKPYQLSIASELGLDVPRTLITNDPQRARDFVRALGHERTVYKTFLATPDCWRETRVLQKEEVALLDAVRLAPVIFQEYVPAEADLRVTMVGDSCFVAAITPAPGGYPIDYRMNLDGARFESTSLPDRIVTGLQALMQELGLVYGAIDLRKTRDGRYVFLEVNPAGEWLFVEDRAGLPITAAMANLLKALARRRS